MKAIVVTPYYYPKLGGLENYARQLGIALRDIKKWEIVVVTSGSPFTGLSQDKVDGIKVYRLGRWIKVSNTPINPFWAFQIKKIVKNESPDVIVAHTPVPFMADSAAVAAGNTPLVVVYHAATLKKEGFSPFNLVVYMYSALEKLTFSKAKKIVVVSDYVKTQMAQKLQNKIEVIPNSVWKNEITNDTVPNKPNNFVFLGSLDKTHAWKGLDQIIRAVSIFKDSYSSSITLTVVGDGDNIDYFKCLVQDLNIEDKVRFSGAKYGLDKTNLIKQATAVIIYPTSSNDAFPTVLLEAWANNVPVIAAKIGPITPLISDSKDGYLVEAKNPVALAAKMLEVSQAKPVDRISVVAAAQKRTLDLYTWEKQAKQFSKLASEVLS